MKNPNSWSDFLNESGICKSGYGGNRPCDNGCPCDKCSASYVDEAYTKWKKKKGIE